MSCERAFTTKLFDEDEMKTLHAKLGFSSFLAIISVEEYSTRATGQSIDPAKHSD